MNKQQFKASVDRAASDLRMNYEHAVGLSQKAARKNTPAGATVPVVNSPQSEYRDWWNDRAIDVRDGLMRDMKSLRNDEGRSVTEAPSAEAAAALQVLVIRDTITQDELNMYYEQYGSNYNVAKALDTIAKRHELSPAMVSYDAIEYERIGRDIERMTSLVHIEDGDGSTMTRISLLASDVADALGLSGDYLL